MHNFSVRSTASSGPNGRHTTAILPQFCRTFGQPLKTPAPNKSPHFPVELTTCHHQPPLYLPAQSIGVIYLCSSFQPLSTNYNEWHAALTNILIELEAYWVLRYPLLPPDGLEDLYKLKLLSAVRCHIQKIHIPVHGSTIATAVSYWKPASYVGIYPVNNRRKAEVLLAFLHLRYRWMFCATYVY